MGRRHFVFQLASLNLHSGSTLVQVVKMKPIAGYCVLFAWFLVTSSDMSVATAEETTEAGNTTTATMEVAAGPTPQLTKSLSSSQTVITEEDDDDGKGPRRTNMTTTGSNFPPVLNGSAGNMSVIPPEAVAAMTTWQNPSKMFNDFFGNAAVVGTGPNGPYAAAGSASAMPPPGFFGGQGQRSPFDVFRRLPPRFPPGWDPNSPIRVPTQRPYREPKITRRRRKRGLQADEGLARQMSPTNLVNEYAAFNIWF